ncbi:ML domain-containing protein [Kitasatospora sp. NPDC093806]|uniref:ML domain-containing protein n=1 Tax=Kitasatospora sp. NPDC093806 TaxID=3155075 RepID=UPI00341E8CC9
MATWSYTDKGSPADALLITGIELSPTPLTPGRTHVFTISATAQTEIADGAYLQVVVKLGLIKLLTKDYDLLAELRGEGTLKLSCATSDGKSPIPKGDTTLTLTVDVPREVPRAKLVFDIRGYTVDDDDLLVLGATADFTQASGV